MNYKESKVHLNIETVTIMQTLTAKLETLQEQFEAFALSQKENNTLVTSKN